MLIPSTRKLVNGEVPVASFSATGSLFKGSETVYETLLFELRRNRCPLDVQNTKAKLMAVIQNLNINKDEFAQS